MAVMISEAKVKAYQEDGVTVLRNVIDRSWIESLRVAVEKALVFAGPHAEIYTKPEYPGLFF